MTIRARALCCNDDSSSISTGGVLDICFSASSSSSRALPCPPPRLMESSMVSGSAWGTLDSRTSCDALSRDAEDADAGASAGLLPVRTAPSPDDPPDVLHVRSTRAETSNGTSAKKRLPLPTSDTTPITPPWRVIISRQMWRPSPDPLPACRFPGSICGHQQWAVRARGLIRRCE